MNKILIIILISLALVVSMAVLILVHKSEYIPAAIFGAFTTMFVALAYFFSQEKFRLDLLDKRWPIYQASLEFCSLIIQYGDFPVSNDKAEDKIKKDQAIKAFQAAENSFRGIGYHKMRSLFGKDIEDYFSKINKTYAWLVSHSDNYLFHQNYPEEAEKRAKKRSEILEFICETPNKLPELFRPYVYFGDHKKG